MPQASSSSLYTVRALAPDELRGPLLAVAAAVYAEALGWPARHARVQAMANVMRRHTHRAGFRGFGAFDAARGGELVGFGYGYASQPGLWWRSQVELALSPEQRADWFADSFELAELHVRPSAQGQHLGSALHDAVVLDAPHRTALLSVMHRSARARRLYASRGWQVLVDELRFANEPSIPFSILGLRLASGGRSGSPPAR